MRGNPFYFSTFVGGLNTRDADSEVQVGQARDLLNVTGQINGAVRKRDGCQSYAAVPANQVSLFGVENFATHFLLSQGGAKFYKTPADTLTPADITGGTVPSNAPWSFISAPVIGGQGPIYMSNGVTTPQRVGSGSVADWTALSGNLPNGKYLAFANNRVWVAGMAAYTPSGGSAVADPGSTIVFSAVGDPTAWPASNVVQFDPNDGDAITGIGTVGPYLLVFKKHKTWVVYDLDSGANRKISEAVGCTSHMSIASTPFGTMFVAERGIYLTDGQHVELVSDIITPTVVAAFSGASLPTNSPGVYINNHYYVAAPAVGGVTKIFDYDLLLKSWWIHTIPTTAINRWVTYRATTLPEIFAVDGSSRIIKPFVSGLSADFGAAFESYWTGAWQSPAYFRRHIINSVDIRKRLRQVRLTGTGTMDAYLGVDFASALALVAQLDFRAGATTFGGSGTFGVSGIYGDPSNTGKGRFNNSGAHNAFSVQFHSNNILPWQINEYIMFITERTD